MMRSVSNPSIGTATGTVGTVLTGRASGLNYDNKSITYTYRGKWLWEGRFGFIVQRSVLAPWNFWWQITIVLIITYKYIAHLLLAYYLETTNHFLTVTFIIGEGFFFFDVIIHLLHAFWPILRLHMRVYKRNYMLLAYDVISLTPLNILYWYRHDKPILVGSWLGIGRIYRLIAFFQTINETMRHSRKKLYFGEHVVSLLLVLHAATCYWYYLHRPSVNTKQYNYFGWVAGSQKLNFDNYITCCYYCTCRVFNCIFGDSFPMSNREKWFTSFLMVFGYVCLKYRFIGALTWWLVLDNSRWAIFVEQYHHMIRFLKFRGAPPWLVEQAKQYKKQLWNMKDGILTSRHLKELPLPMQMELIFDINVRSFHDSLLLRDTDESFMRHISLLMRHEIYLAGQNVWNQGVVKNGMLCVKRGVLEMLSDEDDESPMIAFKEGTVLGEISLFFSIPSKVTVRAATFVELQVLRRTDFMRAMTEYPYMLQEIQAKVDARIKSSKIRQKAIEKYDLDDSRLIRTRYRPMKILKQHLAGIVEEDPTFVDDSHMYYKDENNVIRRKFTTQYLDLYQMSSNVTTIEEPRICLRSTFPWILEPNTDFLKIFEIAHFVMVLYICFTCPHFSANTNVNDREKIFNTIVVAGLIFNIYTQVTTAVVNKNVRKETVREIVEEKMASIWFYLDVISIFPMYIFTDTMDPYNESLATQIAVMLPMLQVWHLWHYLEKWQANFYSNAKLVCLAKYLIHFIIFCYWSGFILYLSSCPKNLCREDSWMAKLIYLETKVFVTNDAKHESPTTSSLSLGTAIFTGSGTANASPGSGDLMLVMVLIILGSYLGCFYVSKICCLYLLSTQRKLKFKDSMRELFYFLSVNHVSGKIKERVKKFFTVQWYYNNAVSSEELFKDMSNNIQQEILALEMIETLLSCPLFQDCSRDFLQTLASKSRSIVLPDKEIVQHAADIGRDMYILIKGYCNKLNQLGKVESSVGPGGNIGVVEMLYGLPKVHTIMTCTNCILLHIEYSSLVQCWSTFPDIRQPIFKVIRSPDIKKAASKFKDGKQLAGKIDTKTNKFSREIKESFVILTSRRDRAQYLSTFKELGVLRYLRYMFLPGCITPHGLFLKLWCIIRFVLAIYYVLIVPYDIAIKRSKNGGGYNWTDIILYIDIIVMSYIAYYDNKSLLITHPFLTMTRYLKHAFLLDIISILPFEEVFKIINEHADTDLYRINRIMLVFRINGAFSYWESDIMRVNQAVILLKFLPIAITLVNFATAFLFINSCIPYSEPTTSYVMVNCTRVMIFSSGTYKSKYAVTEYMKTFYWVFELFVGCGCMPVVGTTRADVLLTMTLQIIGLLYFAFMFGYIASTRTASSHALLDHNENSRDLENFLYQQNVDPLLTVKTLKYFEYVWKRTHGSDPQKICRGLNSALMEDTLVFMYERALREVPLFGKVERSFIRVITQHLQEMYFLKGDTIVKYKDVQANIYIIYRGKVDVLSSYNEMITCMGPGGMFGNFNGQTFSSSEVAIYASRNLDLLVLPAQTFFNLVKYYPKIQEPLQKAFEVSKDYILPISVDNDDSSSDDTDFDLLSQDSAPDSRSGSSRYDTVQLRHCPSSSNMSQAKSSISVMTYQSYLDVNNLLKPGSKLYLGYGYLTCTIATSNYVLALYELVTLNDCFIIFWIQCFCDVFFFIKIYLSMHQGYLNRHGDLILDSSKCRARYYRHQVWMWSDLLANFPLELFGFCFFEPVIAMHYFRANKLFRLKYLVEFYHTTSAELTNNLTKLQTAMTIFTVVLLLHTFTCFWLITITAISPINLIRTVKQHLLEDDMPQQQWDYTTSFYIIVAELTTTGGDEFMIEFILPMIVLAISLVCGKMLAATVIATSMQVEYSDKYALNNYEKINGQLKDVLKNQGLSNYQLKKYCKYVRQLWVTERGRQLPVLLSKTPYVLRCDLMSAMFGQHLRNCFLFADTGHSFLRQLTALLEYSVFFPGNYIVMAGDSEARMHWVASGTVSVVSVRADLTETTHEQLGVGDVFGIIQGLNRGVTHAFSYRAQDRVSILTLSLDSWINLLSYFPNAKKIIAEKSQILFTHI